MISVIMPTFNEAGNIEELIKRTTNALKKDFEIIVVDDNSPDGTSQLVKKLQVNNPFLRLITRTGESGLPSAIKRGINESKGDILAWFDCDLTMPPEKLTEMIDKLKNYDIVIGSRFANGGKDNRGENFTKITSLLLNNLCATLFGNDIRDYTSGFIVCKKEAVKDTIFSGCHGTYFINLLVEAKNNSKRIKEIPYVLTPRPSGQSKIHNPLNFTTAGIAYLKTILGLKIKFLKLKLLK
jgi:dolichol-phosphate mannosyltransferase